MSEEIKIKSSGTENSDLKLTGNLQITVWISLGLVFVISILDLAGWIFDIQLLKSVGQFWEPMKVITAICFVFTSISLAAIFNKQPAKISSVFTLTTSIFLILVSILTLYCWIFLLKTGHDSIITSWPVLNLFLLNQNRMALVTAVIILLTGMIMILLNSPGRNTGNIAHILSLPPAIASYIIPVSYFLNIYSIHQFLDTPVALNTGIAFCSIFLAVFFMKPDSWLMRVFLSQNMGGMMARRLIPAIIVIPVVIGWLRIYGERSGFFISEVGVLLVAVTYTICFILLVWFTARSVNIIDNRRHLADEALKRSNDELETKVIERTSELTILNSRLDREINERKTAEALVAAERQRFNGLLELMPAYMILLNPDYQVSYANRFFRERFGVSNGKRCFEFLFNRSEPCEVCETFRTLKENKPLTWEWTGPDGHIYSIFDFPYTDTDGSPLIMEMGIDVTDLKNAEAGLMRLNTELEKRVDERTNRLMESEKRMRLLVDSLPDTSILLFDKDHRFMVAGGGEIERSGFEKSNLEGSTLEEAYPPEVIQLFAPLYDDALAGKQTTFEHSFGRYHYLQQILPVFDKEGEINSGMVISTNITERKRADKELSDTKNYLQNLIDYANAPIIVWDQENKINLFNHAFEHLTGYKSSEVEGKKLDLLFPGSSLKDSLDKIRRAITENWETIEIPILTKNNEVRTVLWNSARIHDKGRNTYSTIAQGNDITERIKAEVAFKESKEKLELALENGKIGIWEWDITTGYLQWDERMEKMFGWSPGSFENTFTAFERSVHEEDLTHVRNAFRQALEENIPLDTIYRIKHKNEGINYISTKALVEKNGDGIPFKMTGVCFDITEMKKGAERVLFRLNEELLRSNKELEQFAYVASHDLQEPLRMVSSFTQLLAQRYKDKLDKDAQDFIKFAVDGAVRMQVLINDLLDYSRIETRGKEFSPIDMHDVLGSVVNNLRIIIKERSAVITNDEIPVIIADEGQMVQLLQNIIGNALKFCKSTPRIHLSVKEESDYFLFSVKDNGIGIEPQYYNRIFQIFQRLHPKDQYGGTGIGLAICKRIIERHGGKIWVESKPGKGSVFYFTIIKRQITSKNENFPYESN